VDAATPDAPNIKLPLDPRTHYAPINADHVDLAAEEAERGKGAWGGEEEGVLELTFRTGHADDIE
jgi:hypothetical protein